MYKCSVDTDIQHVVAFHVCTKLNTTTKYTTVRAYPDCDDRVELIEEDFVLGKAYFIDSKFIDNEKEAIDMLYEQLKLFFNNPKIAIE